MEPDWAEVEKFIVGALNDESGIKVMIHSEKLGKVLSVDVPKQEVQSFIGNVPLYGVKVNRLEKDNPAIVELCAKGRGKLPTCCCKDI